MYVCVCVHIYIYIYTIDYLILKFDLFVKDYNYDY